MPLLKPKMNEAKQEFISRCIETLTKDKKDKFPSREQRAAVCYSQLDETPREKAAAGKKKVRTADNTPGTKSKTKK